MLVEERHARIISIVNAHGSATVAELCSTLGASESTIRRDLEKLDAAGLLTKVHGGATSIGEHGALGDIELSERRAQNSDAKLTIARYAANLIAPGDFVYLDAGTTVERLIDCLPDFNATYITNSVRSALRLVARGKDTIVLGGELKSVTSALVGQEAANTLERMNFTIGFWGTNGIAEPQGLTTPDRNEAQVKILSMRRAIKRFVLADSSKFDQVSPITFSPLDNATIITDAAPEPFRSLRNVITLL